MIWVVFVPLAFVVMVVGIGSVYSVGYGNGYEAAKREEQEEHYLTD